MHHYLLNNSDVDKSLLAMAEKSYMANALNFKMSSQKHCINKISKAISMKYKIHTTTNSGAAVALQNVKYSCQSKSFLRQPVSYFNKISFQNDHLLKNIQFN